MFLPVVEMQFLHAMIIFRREKLVVAIRLFVFLSCEKEHNNYDLNATKLIDICNIE